MPPICPYCGMESTANVCPHHALVGSDDWAEGNRRYCDFFHRGIVPARLPEDERFLPQYNEAYA